MGLTFRGNAVRKRIGKRGRSRVSGYPYLGHHGTGFEVREYVDTQDCQSHTCAAAASSVLRHVPCSMSAHEQEQEVAPHER
jgi:hypothetical protein